MALLAAGPFREQVKAAMNSAIDSLNEWLAMDIIDRDVSPYTNVINTSVKDDKIDVKVEACLLYTSYILDPRTKKRSLTEIAGEG